MAVFKINLQRNLDMTAGNTAFLDVPKDGDVRVRVIPPVKANGELSFLVENHFRLKSEDGSRGIAVACNTRHNDDEDCFLCALAKHLRDSPDEMERNIGQGRNSIKASKSYYLQVLPSIKEEDGTFSYGDPKLLRLPKSGIDGLTDLLTMQQSAGEPFVIDENEGRDIIVKRKDTGESFTKYTLMAAGVPTSLAKVKPGWETTIWDEKGVNDKLDIKVLSVDEQVAAATRSYPSLDWASIEKELGDV